MWYCFILLKVTIFGIHEDEGTYQNNKKLGGVLDWDFKGFFFILETQEYSIGMI